MKAIYQFIFITAFVLLSGCSQPEDINEMSLSDLQQKKILMALQHHHLNMIGSHGVVLSQALTVRGENHSENLVIGA